VSALVGPELAERVREAGPFDAEACMNCGTCTATCPLGLDVLPRRIFRYVLLGLEDRLREQTETVYSCLLCRLCEESCPARVQIAENVRTLRHHLNRSAFGLEL
jgi:heterodisulfide reductase subunit C